MTPDLLADDTEQQHILDPQPGDPGYGDVGPPPPAPPAPAAPARPRSWLAAIVATAVLAGAGAGAGVSALMHNDSTTTVVSPSTSASGSRNSSVIAKPSDVQGILAKVGPAVAYVRTQAFQSGRFFPSSGAGTGIVLTPDGELLTNAHVVAGATSIKVTVGTDTQSHNATVIGADTNNDLALVKISGVSNLPVADLGSSSALKVGDNVIAIGNALNLQGGMTVTEGIVSALNRSIDATDESLSGLIQTDAAINPGNSGGPLVNSAGQVVGINTATSGDAQNIGFAIAIDKAKPVIDQLRIVDPASLERLPRRQRDRRPNRRPRGRRRSQLAGGSGRYPAGRPDRLPRRQVRAVRRRPDISDALPQARRPGDGDLPPWPEPAVG